MRHGCPDRPRRLLRVEALEERFAPSASSLTIGLDPALDSTGRQVLAVQAYQDNSRIAFALFDTGSSALTFSANKQADFSAAGSPIPVLVKGGGILTGMGGTQTGDVSNPGTVLADGLHVASLGFDKAGAAYFSYTFGPGTALGSKQQVFVGTASGSSSVQTIVGTPILRSAANPNGLAAEIIMDGVTYDLSSIEAGLEVSYPDLRFVQPGTSLYAAAGTTDPVQVRLTLIGADNTGNPSNEITESPIPVANNVGVQLGGATLSGKQFLFDTGSQITAISTAMAKSLGLDLTQPAFTTTVEGVGGPALLPGYVVDSLTVPTSSGGFLTFTKVPVFVADLSGGIDGILGMNLFNTATALIYDPYASGGASFSVAFSLNSTRTTVSPDAEAFLDSLGLEFANALDGPTEPITPPELGSISGVVFNDYNGNGRRDAGDAGIAGRVLYIDMNNDNRLDAGDPMTTTDAQGHYSFAGLQARSYLVVEQIPSGWTPTVNVKGWSVVAVKATDVTGVNFGTHKNVSDPLTAFTVEAYTNMLGRNPTTAEKNSWIAALRRGISTSTLTRALWVTPEHRASEVRTAFQMYMNRAPSALELNQYSGLLMSGWSEDQLAISLMNSPGYLGRYSNAGFLAKLYSDVLGEAIDPSTQYFWSNSIAHGVARSRVVSILFSSVGAIHHRIALQYSMVLHEMVPASSVTNWTTLFQLGRTTSDVLGMTLYGSKNFWNMSMALLA